MKLKEIDWNTYESYEDRLTLISEHVAELKVCTMLLKNCTHLIVCIHKLRYIYGVFPHITDEKSKKEAIREANYLIDFIDFGMKTM